MWPFDPVKTKYPRSWADVSLEYRCFGVFFLSMMFMLLLSRQISAPIELLIAIFLILAFIALSIRHRSATGWRWAGVRRHDLWMAGVTVFTFIFFLYYALPFSESGCFSPLFLPWELAVIVMGSFFVLQQLKIVEYSESAFRESCGRGTKPTISTGSEPEPLEARWKRLVRGVYTIAFFLFWAGLVARPQFLIGVPTGAVVAVFTIFFIEGFIIHFVLGVRTTELSDGRGDSR
jgi:hypothetical protein